MVSLVAKRYMRVVNGSLVVCLSKYLPLSSVCILVIKVCFVKRSGIAIRMLIQIGKQNVEIKYILSRNQEK